ncbi:MAG: septum formation initiator family protein [Nitrospira sp.]|nr:septum formation initiator family protein [bacterium]MBL7050415.1 septum formation initiator family protein [Nitrospira sp.]
MIFIALTGTLIVGENGLFRFMELKQIRDELSADADRLKKKNEDIRLHVQTLEDQPEQVEALAREYGFTREGELIFKFEDNE